MRKWLQLFRAQTAPATVFSILVPYLLAGGRDPITITMIMVLGTLLHFFSFGHNSVMDYWYDIRDPNKKHHPLMAGTISLERAHQVVHYGLALIVIAFGILTMLVSPNPIIALLALLSYVVWGHAYNDGLDKNTSHSWLSISLCFTSLSLYGWLMGSGKINETAILIALWAFLTIFYQIAWEGNLKDLWNPIEKHNLLKKLGVRLESAGAKWKLVIPKWLDNIMYYIRVWINTIVVACIAVTLGYSIEDNILFLIVFAVTFAAKAYATEKLHKTIRKVFRREELLECFGKAEALEFFHFMTLLYVVGLEWLWILLLLYGLAWFVGMNKLLWKTRFGPRV